MVKLAQHSSVANVAQCRTYGHILRTTLSPGERLCTRCGKKVYCPTCTAHIPQGATLAYRFEHDPLEVAPVERSVRS
jgi:ferredoxin